MKKAVLFVLASLILVCCKNSDKRETGPAKVETYKKPKADTCLFADGKSFSNIRQACIGLDSLPFKLNPLRDGMMTEGDPAYLLFDGSKTKAELFLPEQDQGILLEKTAPGNWADDDYLLIAWKGYVLKRNDVPIYGGQ